MLAEKQVQAQRLADKARRLGFQRVGFLIRDASGHPIFTEGALDELFEWYYAPGELVSVDVLLDFAGTKAVVRSL